MCPVPGSINLNATDRVEDSASAVIESQTSHCMYVWDWILGRQRLREIPLSLHPAREAAARATRRTCAAEAAGLAQRRCCAHHDHAREGRGYGVQGRFNLHTMRGLARTKRRHEAVVFSRGLPWPHRTQRGLCAITSEENSVVASTQTRPCAASESPVARSSCRG